MGQHNNINVQLGSLDFESIKSSIIEHLKTQNDIKDYEYEGSAAQVLLDILAYNTLYYGYYSNMIASEMFLDTAQKEESIISLVKPLGYVVPGKTSARGRAKIRVGGNGTLVPIWTRFTGNSSSGIVYNFYVIKEGSLDTNGENTFDVVEGKNLVKEQPLLVNQTTKKGFLLGLDIDISTIVVEVYSSDLNDDGAEIGWQPWTLVSGIQDGLNQTSKVYWLERTELGFFVVFGGGFDSSYGQVGAELTPNQQVRVSYLKSSGSLANSVGNFTLKDFSVSTAVSETVKLSSGGTDKPNMEAIRFFAPKWFASQNRAVTIDDCIGILVESGFVTSGDEDPYSKFTVWGGEEMDPPRYGRLFVSLNETQTQNPISAADAINILQDKTCVTIIPEFMNLAVYEGLISGELVYEPNLTSMSGDTLLSLAKNKLSELYPTRFNLKNFDSSTITNSINSIDDAFSVNSGDIALKLIKKVPVGSNGRIGRQNFKNTCLEGSLDSDWFTAHEDFSASGLIRIWIDSTVDKDGFQKIWVKDTTGSSNYPVGKWQPSTGIVDIVEPLFADENINLYVRPNYVGTDKFNMKENMYFSNIVFDLQMRQRN